MQGLLSANATVLVGILILATFRPESTFVVSLMSIPFALSSVTILAKELKEEIGTLGNPLSKFLIGWLSGGKSSRLIALGNSYIGFIAIYVGLLVLFVFP